MLKINNIEVFYGDVQALKGINMEVNQGEIVTLVGSNASGKSTTIKTISGINKASKGSIEFKGVDITNLPSNKIVDMGLIQIPEARRLFPFMSVLENLELGAYTRRARNKKNSTLELIYELFPILKDRTNQLAGSLSGGEQQMCAIARGLMAQPELLMFDEPSLGLAPLLVKKVFETVKQINDQGITVLLVEQNVVQSLKITDVGYVIETGSIVLKDNGSNLLGNEYLKKAYLGI